MKVLHDDACTALPVAIGYRLHNIYLGKVFAISQIACLSGFFESSVKESSQLLLLFRLPNLDYHKSAKWVLSTPDFASRR